MSKIYVWFKTNKLKVIIEKSNYMNFSPNEPNDNFTVALQDNFLMNVKSVKYLGIYIQNNLKWDMLIKTRIKSLFKLKHLFKYLIHYIDIYKLLLLYRSLFVSCLVCGIEVFSNLPKFLIHKLQTIQNKFFKIILKVNCRTPTLDLPKSSEILLIEDLITFRQCVFIFDLMKNRSKINYGIISSFKTNEFTHGYDTRNKDSIHLEKYSSCKSKMIINIWSLSWNKLSKELKQTTDRNVFKMQLFKSIINNY